MTWSSCASVNAIGAIGLACSSNAGIGGGLRELADRLGTAAARGIPFIDERGRDPGPTVERPLRRLAPEPAMAGAVAKIRLIGPFVFLSPLRYELGQLRFSQCHHLKQGDALFTEIVRLRHLFFVYPPFFGARSRARPSHDLIFMTVRSIEKPVLPAIYGLFLPCWIIADFVRKSIGFAN